MAKNYKYVECSVHSTCCHAVVSHSHSHPIPGRCFIKSFLNLGIKGGCLTQRLYLPQIIRDCADIVSFFLQLGKVSGEKTEIFWYFAKPAAEGGSDGSKTFWGLKRGIIWLKMEEQNVKMVFLQKKNGGLGFGQRLFRVFFLRTPSLIDLYRLVEHLNNLPNLLI